ncbi:MAG TPA: PAS domain S-box protein [Planctomycetota bacterium]|nr:PAS domain S-box protein [Planctomycetota bacterium]
MTRSEDPRPAPELNGDQLRLLLEGLSDHAIFSLDAEGLIRTWNRGAAALSGYSAEEVLGRPFSMLFPPEDVARGVPTEILRRAGQTREAAEGWRLRKNGSRFWAYSEMSVVRDASGRVAGYVEITCDITDKKIGAEAVERSEEAFRLLVQSVQDYAIYMLDRRGNVASWNAGAERIKGYSANEIIGEHYSRFFTPEDIAAGRPEENLRIAAEQGHYEGEGWRLRKDGARFWASVTLTPLRDEQGRLRGFAKVTRDMSARKRTEELLRQSEERSRQLLEGIRDYAVYMLDPDGRVASWNPGAERVKGFRADEVLGRHVSLFYTVEDVSAGKPEKDLQEAVEKGVYAGEGWRVRRDGSIYWADVTINTIRDVSGALRGFAKVTRDVTGHRKAQEELRRAEERFRLLVDGIREYALFMLDPTGRIVSWNPGAERLKGYKAEEAIGLHHGIFYPPEDRSAGKPRRLLETAVSEGQARDEGWRVRKDGSRFWADVLITALYDAGGLLRGFSKVTRDLTERRRREEDIRRLNADLQERVTDLNAFASTVAHDVASPMRAVGHYAELVLDEYGSRIPEEGRQYLRRIVGAAGHMRRLVDDLLTYSRLGHEQVRPVPVDVEALLEEILLEMAHVLGESKAQVRLEKPLPKVQAHPVLLRQALTNLISNAVKFAQPGSPPSVVVRAEVRDGPVRILVEDNGIGIGPEDVERVFRPFERLESAKGFPGTGLGLAIVRRSVERMDGKVGLEPAPGGGTRFWIELPPASK